MKWDEEELVYSAASPDGALRLEEYCLDHERRAADYRLRLVRADGAEQFVGLGNSDGLKEAQFGPDGSLGLTLYYEGQEVPVRVDARQWTFRLRPGDAPEPLAVLARRLREQFPRLPNPPTAREVLVHLRDLTGCLAAVALSVWMLWWPGAVPDRGRWAAWAGLAMFGPMAV